MPARVYSLDPAMFWMVAYPVRAGLPIGKTSLRRLAGWASTFGFQLQQPGIQPSSCGWYDLQESTVQPCSRRVIRSVDLDLNNQCTDRPCTSDFPGIPELRIGMKLAMFEGTGILNAQRRVIMKLTALIEREGDGYVSLCPELDVASQGKTIEEARDNLREALELFLESASPTEIKQRLRDEVFVTQIEVAVG
jgi:predicted RNase H-like HicB family nuclease